MKMEQMTSSRKVSGNWSLCDNIKFNYKKIQAIHKLGFFYNGLKIRFILIKGDM
jgi:hypothetical protein